MQSVKKFENKISQWKRTAYEETENASSLSVHTPEAEQEVWMTNDDST